MPRLWLRLSGMQINLQSLCAEHFLSPEGRSCYAAALLHEYAKMQQDPWSIREQRNNMAHDGKGRRLIDRIIQGNANPQIIQTGHHERQAITKAEGAGHPHTEVVIQRAAMWAYGSWQVRGTCKIKSTVITRLPSLAKRLQV